MDINPKLQARLDQFAKLPPAGRFGVLGVIAALIAGGYFFLPAIRAFSGGVAADDDHEIVRVRTRRDVRDLPDVLRAELGRHGRPNAALRLGRRLCRSRAR